MNILRMSVATALFFLSVTSFGVALGQEGVAESVEGQDEQEPIEFREPPSHLVPIPAIAFDSAKYRVTEAQKQEIAALIEQLTTIDNPDYGMAPLMSGSQFAPVKSSQQFGSGIIMIDHGLKTSTALMRLVELGPRAIPVLLEKLTDGAPSKLVMDWNGVMGAMWHGREIPMNAAHPTEQRVKLGHADVLKPDHHFGGFEDHIEKHEVTRGDICFVIVGQIVNRCYQATRYQPTSCMVVNSPTHDPAIAEIIREIWASDDPAKTLFDSLITDFHTRGGSAQYQIGAAMRLLYYFPDEARELIVRRLDDFDVQRLKILNETDWEPWRKQQERNGDVRVGDFVKAVAFGDDPAITAAILRVVERTDDPSVFQECLNPAVARVAPELVRRRMLDIVSVAPPPQQGPFGGEYHTLRAAVVLFPEQSRPLFEKYLEHGTLECRRAVVHALKSPETPVPWSIEFLAPLLDDQADTKWRYGPDYDRKPIRVCDEAAQTIVTQMPGALFELEGETENLDRQIATLKKQIAGEPVVQVPAAKPQAIDFEALPKLEPLASFVIEQQIGQIYSFSDQKTIFAGFGYKADCWAYDTVSIDVASGSIVKRVKFDEWNGGVTILRPIIGEHAVCYHPYAGGVIVVRDLKSGAEITRVQTPFKDGPPMDDAVTVRNLGDIFVTGDGRSIVAITPDASLHSIDLETGKHEVVWKREGKPKFEGMGFHGRLTPMEGTNRFMVEFFAEDDQFLRVWDHDTRAMQEIEKVPNSAWRNAWGKFACNHLNNNLVLWDLEARKPVKLPLPEEATVADLQMNHKQSVLVVAITDGKAILIDLQSNKPIAILETPQATGRVALTFSNDDQQLFWGNDQTVYDRKTGDQSNQKTQFAVFDMATFKK